MIEFQIASFLVGIASGFVVLLGIISLMKPLEPLPGLAEITEIAADVSTRTGVPINEVITALMDVRDHL